MQVRQVRTDAKYRPNIACWWAASCPRSSSHSACSSPPGCWISVSGSPRAAPAQHGVFRCYKEAVRLLVTSPVGKFLTAGLTFPQLQDREIGTEPTPPIANCLRGTGTQPSYRALDFTQALGCVSFRVRTSLPMQFRGRLTRDRPEELRAQNHRQVPPTLATR